MYIIFKYDITYIIYAYSIRNSFLQASSHHDQIISYLRDQSKFIILSNSPKTQ